MGPPWLGLENHDGSALRNISKTQVLRRLENAILNVTLANYGVILIIFYTEFTESVLDVLSYPESTIRPTMVGPEKTF